MAGVKISALPAVVTPLTTDYFPVVQAGVTKRETLDQVQTLFGFSGGVLAPASGGTGINNGTNTLTLAGSVTFAGAFSPTLTFTAGNNYTFPSASQTLLGLSGGTLVGDLVLFSSSPPTSLSAASKGYVDAQIAAFASVFVAKLASTTALTVVYNNGSSGVGATLTNAGAMAALSLDGVAAAVNDLVLIKNQASALQNGLYTVTAIGSGAVNWVLTRTTSYDAPSEISPGDLFVITAGSTLADTTWIQTATVTAVGTDSINYSQYSAALPIALASGGTGASLTASNGGIFYSTASAGAILSGTATAQQLLMSGASTTPQWSTTTYPLTNAINTIMYASSANVLGVITPVNSAVLISSAGGVPSMSTTLPSGIAATNMTLTTPSLGVATATSVNKMAITAPATSSTLAVADGKTLTCSNTLTFTGTDTSSVAFGAGGTVLYSGASVLQAVKMQVFTGSGTYTPSTGMKYCIVEGVGGGGGGGGAAGAATQCGTGGGGGGGGYFRKTFTAANIGASATVTIGAAGTNGSAGNNNGVAGGNTTFVCAGTGVTLTGNGGALGQGCPATASNGIPVNSGTGGTATNGDVNISGGLGNYPSIQAFATGVAFSGAGGNSHFGLGGALTTNTNTGNGASGYGGGGGGGCVTTNTNVAGGSGNAGVVIVTEFCNQ